MPSEPPTLPKRDSLQAFIEQRRQLSERIAARAAAGTGLKYRMRLRVRLGHKLKTEEKELRLKFRGRRVYLRSSVRGKLLNESNWVVFSATRFRTLEEAARFGHALQKSLSVACALRNTPIDVGADNSPTGRFSDYVKQKVEASGGFILDDVHGLDVYPDSGTAFVLAMEATLSVLMTAESLVEPADTVGSRIDRVSEEAELSCYLLNAAAMSGHPVATATLAISAVELLSQTQKRSPVQKKWIKGVRTTLEQDSSLSDGDKADLLKAVNSMFNVGVSQNVKNMMTRLDLADQHARWDAIYTSRSELFHGARRFTQGEIVNLGSEASDLCRLIVRRFVLSQTGPLNDL